MSEVPRPHEFNIYRPQEVAEFYRELFGKDAFKPNPDGDGGWLIETRNPDDPIRIAMEMPEDARLKSVMVARFFVNDIDTCKERVLELEGEVDPKGVLEARGEGKVLLCFDPWGNSFILFEPEKIKGGVR